MSRKPSLETELLRLLRRADAEGRADVVELLLQALETLETDDTFPDAALSCAYLSLFRPARHSPNN